MGESSRKKKRKIAHRFYVPPFCLEPVKQGKSEVKVDRLTAHHMRNVLRLSAGARVVLFDGSGREFEGEIVSSKPSGVTVRIENSRTPSVESRVRVILAQALLKGNSFDRLLALATELGVAGIVPLFTSRVVVKLTKAQAADRVKRWQRIAQEAAAQSGRVLVPEVEMPADLDEFLSRELQGEKFILYEKARREKPELKPRQAERVIILAGPEGGFEQAEVKAALERGFKVWGLGPRILRAEHAGPIACALIQFKFGDMG